MHHLVETGWAEWSGFDQGRLIIRQLSDQLAGGRSQSHAGHGVTCGYYDVGRRPQPAYDRQAVRRQRPEAAPDLLWLRVDVGRDVLSGPLQNGFHPSRSDVEVDTRQLQGSRESQQRPHGSDPDFGLGQREGNSGAFSGVLKVTL